MARVPPARNAAFDLATIALFLAAILAPTIDRFLRPSDVRDTLREGRPPERRPSLVLTPEALRLFPDRFERWFNDTCGLRDKLLRWNSIEKIELLHVAPTSKVVLGNDDWILYTEGRTMRVWRGLDPFSPADLEAWTRVLERNRDRLAERGIGYVFAIGPNKETIYPEKVPARFNRVGPTRLEQLAEHLRSHSDFRILDLRVPLLAAKRDDTPGDELYFRDGTHWNARGSLAAYEALVAALRPFAPGLAPIDASRRERVRVPDEDDDWRYRMWVADRNPQSAWTWKIVPEPAAVVVRQTGPPGMGRVRVTEVPSPTPLRVLMLHDSFATYGESLLEETVSHLAKHWTPRFDEKDLAEEKPAVVVQFLVERSLVLFQPSAIALDEPADR
jgi:hypothetical protein